MSSNTVDPQRVPAIRVPRRVVAGGVAAAVIGAIVLAFGAWLAPGRTMAGYLSVMCSAVALALGALVLLMIVHVMKAKWPVPIRRIIEAIVMALPALAVGFVPVLAFADRLYPWALPEALPEHVRAIVENKGAYLQVSAFAARAIAVWAVWLVVSELLLHWSRQQDDRDRPALRRWQRRLSAGALPLVALTLTVAAFDWIMSLEPTWYSSMFGLDIFASGFVAAIAGVIVLVAAADRPGGLRELVNDSHDYALGRLLLAFTVFWAYIVFFQVFIQWIGNRPEEIEWYLHRLRDGWQIVAITIGIGHFAVPFIALLSYRLKRRRRALAAVAMLVVAMHLVDMHWKIIPAFSGAAIVHWADLGAVLFVFGLCVASVAWRIDGRAIAPRFDRALGKGTRYHSV